jgi:AraC family transcriptional regulator
MMTTHTSPFATPHAGSKRAAPLWQAANRYRESTFRRAETRTDFGPMPSACDLIDETVEISPIGSVRRHCAGRHGIVAESIYVPLRSSIKTHYSAPVHLLVLYEDGARRDGETSIGGLPPSMRRKFANMFTFVPAGHPYREWHETSTPLRMTYLYFDPAELQVYADADAPYTPKIHFEDSILWATAIKVKTVLEDGNRGPAYLEALVNLLAHELPRSGQEPVPASTNRGGLAGWQRRAADAYIEEHLNQQISLATLARIARLSQYHFCRAFKQSFGIPPLAYHLRRRMQRAMVLLSDPAASITEVGLTLGYSNSGSFSLGFRKITGQTPRDFRRNLE